VKIFRVQGQVVKSVEWSKKRFIKSSSPHENILLETIKVQALLREFLKKDVKATSEFLKKDVKENTSK